MLYCEIATLFRIFFLCFLRKPPPPCLYAVRTNCGRFPVFSYQSNNLAKEAFINSQETIVTSGEIRNGPNEEVSRGNITFYTAKVVLDWRNKKKKEEYFNKLWYLNVFYRIFLYWFVRIILGPPIAQLGTKKRTFTTGFLLSNVFHWWRSICEVVQNLSGGW